MVQTTIRFHNGIVKPAIVLLLLTTSAALYAKDKHPKKQDSSQDQITVVAHIPSTGGPVTRFIPTEHYGRTYVYAEHESGKTLTLIDLTNPGRPEVVADVANPGGTAGASLLTATGTAALVTDTAAVETKPAAAQTIRIMNLADPQHPAVAQEFQGVTATSNHAGLILLANADGIWILQQHFALDPAAEKSYAYKVVYGESMYH